MSTRTIDEKFSLVQKMRARADSVQNQMHLTSDRPVYRKYTDVGMYPEENGELANQEFRRTGTFRLRLFVCLLAFGAFFGLYKMKIEIKGYQAEEAVKLLEENKLPDKTNRYMETMAGKLVGQMQKPEQP